MFEFIWKVLESQGRIFSWERCNQICILEGSLGNELEEIKYGVKLES